jgi:hypothetical protein
VKKAKKAVPAPDNGDRAEFLTLGKKYKLPNEKDDEDYHLDAGTTFLNAYKSLKPDQIASMSKDTQDLMQTQKQLMGTLATLKPLINDGKEMMNPGPERRRRYLAAPSPNEHFENQNTWPGFVARSVNCTFISGSS